MKHCICSLLVGRESRCYSTDADVWRIRFGHKIAYQIYFPRKYTALGYNVNTNGNWNWNWIYWTCHLQGVVLHYGHRERKKSIYGELVTSFMHVQVIYNWPCWFWKISYLMSLKCLIGPAVIASAGSHQTCLPSWRKESSARVYATYVSSEILWGSKDKNFLGHFWRD